MPELPEVQIFVNSIAKNYIGKPIADIIFRRKNLRYPLDTENLKKIFSPEITITNCFRTGKQLVLETKNGAVNISLGMTGSFKETNIKSPEKHEHITLLFSDKTALGYLDPRRFGYWSVYDSSKQSTATDPLNEQALLQLFKSDKVINSNRSIKDLLMDQKLIGGIGNIYALEVLFTCQIHPLQSCTKVTKKNWSALARHIPSLLTKAIELKVSSIASYRTFEGDKGGFQKLHRVYNRNGEKCVTSNCKALISRIAQSGRSSWFCPVCQKSPVV